MTWVSFLGILEERLYHACMNHCQSLQPHLAILCHLRAFIDRPLAPFRLIRLFFLIMACFSYEVANHKQIRQT